MLRTFTECTATCGKDGTRHRQYECELLAERKGVVTDYCAHIPEPKFFEACNRIPCSLPTFVWESSQRWSECSTTCGPGIQQQLYRCVRELDRNRELVKEMFCSDITSPNKTRPCSNRHCVEYTWNLTQHWEQCSHECGDDGVQYRKIQCERLLNGKPERVVGSYLCAKSNKPVDVQECNRRSCYSFRWTPASGWDPCSHTCGDQGFRSRQAVCMNVTYDSRERRVDERYCDTDLRPVVLEPCSREPCATFEWRFDGDWIPECRTSCNSNHVAQQTRNVVCYKIYTNGQPEQTYNQVCDGANKPDDVKQCPELDCPSFKWSSTDEWTACSASCGLQSLQTEVMRCRQVFSNGTEQEADDSRCPPSKPETTTRVCDVMPCARYAVRHDPGILFTTHLNPFPVLRFD